MKRTKQTALTAAIFAAAIGVSSAGSIPAEAQTQDYLAATDQRAMQVLYGPAPLIINGDADRNLMLDARDLTLLKRKLLITNDWYEMLEIPASIRHISYLSTDYNGIYDADDDACIRPADVRKLRNTLTGMKEPESFSLYILPVPYLSSKRPESEEERKVLREKAEAYANRYYRVYAYNGNAFFNLDDNGFLDETDLLTGEGYTWFSPGLAFDYKLDYTRVSKDDSQSQTTRDALLLFQFLSDGDAPEPDPPAFTDGFLSLPKQQREKDIRFDIHYITYAVRDDGSEYRFDKMLLEYDVLTGETEIAQILTPDEELTLPESDF